MWHASHFGATQPVRQRASSDTISLQDARLHEMRSSIAGKWHPFVAMPGPAEQWGVESRNCGRQKLNMTHPTALVSIAKKWLLACDKLHRLSGGLDQISPRNHHGNEYVSSMA
jgi:hypothetical protein